MNPQYFLDCVEYGTAVEENESDWFRNLTRVLSLSSFLKNEERVAEAAISLQDNGDYTARIGLTKVLTGDVVEDIELVRDDDCALVETASLNILRARATLIRMPRRVGRRPVSLLIPAIVIAGTAVFGAVAASPPVAPSFAVRIAYERGGDRSPGAGDLVTWIAVSDAKGHAKNITSRPRGKEHRIDSGSSWSPDGRRLAFIRDSPSRSAVYVWEGKRRPRLILATAVRATNSGFEGLDWSPDGRALVVGGSVVRTIGADGRRHRKLTDDPGCDPQWSPTGKQLLFFGCFAHTAESRLRTLVPGQPAQGVTEDNVQSAAWSPDGRSIAIAEHCTDLPGPEEDCAISIITSDGRRHSTLGSATGEKIPLVWDRSGGSVFAGERGLTRFDVATRKATRLDARFINAIAVARSRGVIAYAVQERVSTFGIWGPVIFATFDGKRRWRFQPPRTLVFQRAAIVIP